MDRETATHLNAENPDRSLEEAQVATNSSLAKGSGSHSQAASEAGERKRIGIVASFDSALLEVTCLLAYEGVDVSQAIGVTSCDPSQKAADQEMLSGLRALQADPGTEVIMLVAGLSAPGAVQPILDQVRRSDKPTVICFLGTDRHLAWRAGGVPASRLDEAAMRAAAWVRGWDQALISAKLEDQEERLAIQARRLHARIGPGRRRLVGLLSGGVLYQEAQIQLSDTCDTAENIALHDLDAQPVPADRFWLVQDALADPEIAVVLVDLEARDDAAPDPRTALAPILRRTHDEALVVAHIRCPREDLQRTLMARLCEAGVIVMPSNAAAARLAGMILSELTVPKKSV
jgi:FdrA protein